MRILVCSPQYPTETDPTYSFVEQLASEFARQGVTVSVIAPQSLVKHWVRGKELHPRHRIDNVDESCIEVFQPYYLSFGGHFEKLNEWLQKRAVRRAYRQLKVKPDVFYGHFWHSAYKLYPIASKKGAPLFVASGESRITIMDVFDKTKLKTFTDFVSGVICVSTKNKEESIEKSLTEEDKCIVVPNAIDNGLFYQKDKHHVREQLGIDPNVFVIAFVGAFIPRKGSGRVSEAIKLISGESVYSIFIGAPYENEDTTPECDNILFKGKLPHCRIPDYLSAADVFVLPTLEEGCCNAIIEAMACGLPIISSDRSFNYDVLDHSNSLLIDPMNIKDIAESIVKLRDDKVLRSKMSCASLAKARDLTLPQRASRILSFIRSHM